MEIFKILIVICVLSFSFVNCRTGTYRAAVVDTIVSNENKLVSTISDAAKLNVDILMLPGVSTSGVNSTQQIKQIISNAAKDAKMYIAMQTVEETDDGEEMSNFIFDRNGQIVSYRKAVGMNDAPVMETLTTDFGVKFGVLIEKDLLLTEHLEGVKNVIAFGPSINDTGFPYAKQFPGSWSYTTRSNLVTTSGVYGGATVRNGNLLIVADTKSDMADTFPVKAETSVSELGLQDASEYSSVLLHAIGQHTETVCHEHFCCHFDVRVNTGASAHTLVAYNGVRGLGASPVRVQACAVLPCRAHECTHESEGNETNTVFEKLSVSASFSEDSVQYPIVISSTHASYEDFKFHVQRNGSHASIELSNRDIVSFGIFGTIAKDLAMSERDVKFADLAVENLQEVFDYVWVRLRVFIFIASIYVLEMM